jgi:hypothetical protein
MRVKRIAQAVGAMTLAPLLVLATSVAAHADSDVHWTHKPDNKCLEPGCNWAGAPDDVAVHSCHNTVAFWATCTRATEAPSTRTSATTETSTDSGRDGLRV